MAVCKWIGYPAGIRETRYPRVLVDSNEQILVFERFDHSTQCLCSIEDSPPRLHDLPVGWREQQSQFALDISDAPDWTLKGAGIDHVDA